MYDYLFHMNLKFYHCYMSNNVLYMEIYDGIKREKKAMAHDIYDFSTTVTFTDLIHVVYINFKGELVHIYGKNDEWRKKIITNFNIKENQIKNIRLYITNNSLNIFLIVVHKNNLSELLHYTIKENSIKTNKISRIIYDKYISYHADVDKKNDIHLIYRLKDNTNQLFYKIFNSEYNRWSVPVKLSSSKEDVIEMSILCDTDDNVHVVWSSLNGKNMISKYINKKNNGSLACEWKSSKTQEDIIGTFSDLSVLQLENYIKLIWKQNNKFYCTYTKIKEDSWSNIGIINTHDIVDFSKIIYVGITYKDFKNIKIPIGYAYFDRSIYILGIDKINKNNDHNTVSISKLIPKKEISIQNIIKEEHAISLEDMSIKGSLLEYSNHIKYYFENKNTIAELTNKANSKKTIDINKEIELLKQKELILLKDISQIREGYQSINRKIDYIVKDKNNMKSNKQNNESILKKIIQYINKKYMGGDTSGK